VLLEHGPEMGVDGAQLFVGRQAVDRRRGDAGELLPLQSPDPFHEKFIEIGGKDRQKSRALQKRNRFVLGKLQHPMIEIEPADFAIQIFGGVRSIRRNLRRLGRGMNFGGAFGHVLFNIAKTRA